MNSANPGAVKWSGWKLTAAHIAVITLVSGAVFFTNLGQARLWDRDEPRNAGCAAEMMARGDWVVPTFNGELRQQKPVLLYWLIMSAYAVLGQNELAARIWSAILALGTVWLTYGIARRLIGSSVALLAALALATSLMFTVAARAATPDSVLIFFSTLAIWFYVVGTFRPGEEPNLALRLKEDGRWFPGQYRFVVGMYGAMAMGVLAKGPVGLVLPTAIVGMFLLIQRLPPLSAEFWSRQGRVSSTLLRIVRPFSPGHFLRTCWAMRPLTALALVILIAGPWYAWVGYRTDGEFLRRFLLTENFGRATEVFESHSGGLWFYPLAILIGFFPWSIFALPVALNVDRQLTHASPRRAALLFLLCWVAVQVGLFSLASTKLPSYVTPCYPALAILTGMFLQAWMKRTEQLAAGWSILAVSGLITVGVALTIGLAYAGMEWLDGKWTVAWVGAVLMAGGAAATWLAWTDRRPAALTAVSLTAVAFAVALFGFGTVAVDAERKTELVLQSVRESDRDTKLATYRCLESSWVVYGQRPIYELDPSSQPTGLDLQREAFWETKPRLTPEEFARLEPQAIYLTTDEHVEELQTRLPDGYQVVREAPFFLKQGRQLLLLKRPEADRLTAEPDDVESLR